MPDLVLTRTKVLLSRVTLHRTFDALVIVFCLVNTGCDKSDNIPGLVDAQTQEYLERGLTALVHHDFEGALALADSAEQRNADVADVYFLRGRVYSEMLRWKEAEASYLKALKLQPDYPGVYNNLGNNAVRQTRFRDGLRLYRKELESYPSSPIPWRGIGMTYVDLGEADSAQMAFREALKLDSAYVSVYTDLAQLLIDDGQFEDALKHALQALRYAPDDLTAVYLTGTLFSRVGRNEEAILYLKRATESWPWHNPSYYALGQALLRLGKKEEGQAYIKHAEQLRAADARINQLEATVRKLPRDAYSHAGLASALRRVGRYNDAMHAYRIAYNLDPKNLEFRNNIAALHLVRGDTSLAIQWYKEALRLDPEHKTSTSIDILLNLGVVYAISGDNASARRAWESVLRVKPDQPDARRYLNKISTTAIR